MVTLFVPRPFLLTKLFTERMQTDQEKSLVRVIREEAKVAQEQQLDMKSNEVIRVGLGFRLTVVWEDVDRPCS